MFLNRNVLVTWQLVLNAVYILTFSIHTKKSSSPCIEFKCIALTRIILWYGQCSSEKWLEGISMMNDDEQEIT